MTLLQALLTQAKMQDALLFRSATLAEAQSLSIALVKAGFPRIPRDYLKFLELSDGLLWNELELFSCGTHERAGTVFNQPEILNYQTKYAVGQFFSKRLVLGRSTECLVCYEAQNRCYELIDRNSLSVMLKFPRFEDLLYQVMTI